jgi:hypothetical protein
MGAPRLGPPRLSADEVAALISGARRVGEGRWVARCPAHGDRTPSLSIRQGDDGAVLLHDHGGCSFQEVAAALGLEPCQLFPERDRAWRPIRPRLDPQHDARALLRRLVHLHDRPPAGQLDREMAQVGRVLLGGTPALAVAIADGGRPSTFRLRLLIEAALVVALEGVCYRFSVVALAREIDRYGGRGYARRLGLYPLARAAVRAAAGAPA